MSTESKEETFLNLPIPSPLHRRLKGMAVDRGMSLKDLVYEVLFAFVYPNVEEPAKHE